ncbi:MAG: hypothetical protein CTY19_02225 [Methylomonas sp.]|nr:MAG: hypothetical protein CTY19_02225 [Methylomonas sp.]
MEFSVFPTVGSIAQKSVLRATQDMTLQAVSNLLDQHNVSSVLIEKDSGYYVFSVEDLLQHTQDGRHIHTQLNEVPLKKIPSISEHEHILAGMEVLERSQGRYLGILDDDDKLSGILTYSDIISAIDPAVLVQKKTIGEMVSRSEPVTFSAEWILEDVLNHLRNIEDSIIVVDNGIPVGIVTTKDIFGIISSGKSTALPLSSYMVSPVITTPIFATIHDALNQLKSLKIKRCVVVDAENQLVGVVTQSELVGFAYGTWVDLIKHHASELKELVSILESKALGFEKSALEDPLTGLGNRRMLQKRLKEEIERIRRYNTDEFSLLIIDIDYFKNINDSYGHLIGDEVIKAISQKLTDFTRTMDDVIRWGGEEFAILLPHTSLTNAYEFANRIRLDIENAVFLNRISITVSIAVGQFSMMEKENEFFDRVDKALFRAKKQGRNCVVVDYTV